MITMEHPTMASIYKCTVDIIRPGTDRYVCQYVGRGTRARHRQRLIGYTAVQRTPVDWLGRASRTSVSTSQPSLGHINQFKHADFTR